jgi:hypothetical protein
VTSLLLIADPAGLTFKDDKSPPRAPMHPML